MEQTPHNDLRIHALARYIKAWGETPSGAQVSAFGDELHREKAEAYRQTLINEAKTWGHYASGPIDPSIDSGLQRDAHSAAWQIASTYQKNRLMAAQNGQNLDDWASNYAEWKAKQVQNYEYRKAANQAQQMFYSQNNLPAKCMVVPVESTPDVCEHYINQGWMDISALYEQDFPAHPNCFIAGTVVAGPSIHTAFSRPYEGPLITIRTASGNTLTGTPNHPILTPEGWIPLGQLREGQCLFSCLDGERMSSLVNPDKHQVPSPIEDVLGTSAMPLLNMPSSPADFHGDGIPDCYVHIKRANGSLQDGSLYPVGQLASTITRPGLQFLSRLRPEEKLLRACHAASRCIMRDFYRLGARPKVNASLHQTPPQSALRNASLLGKLRGRLSRLIPRNQFFQAKNLTPDIITHRNPDITEPSSEHLVTDADFVRQRIAGFTSLITKDEVIKTWQVDASCHVYNLSTDEGWYAANNIIVSNCPHVWLVIPATHAVRAPQPMLPHYDNPAARIFQPSHLRGVRKGEPVASFTTATKGKSLWAGGMKVTIPFDLNGLQESIHGDNAESVDGRGTQGGSQ